MIRAAIELGGTAVILVGCAVALWYGLYYLRHEKRKLDRQESREEAEYKKEPL
jgi:hypothetical protein